MLIGRVILGVVLFAHGWQKLMINGIAGTYGQFEKLGIPLAIVSASFASFVEFVGGVMIILGALTTTVVALDLVVMIGAAGFVHLTHGIFAQNGGWELVGVIVVAELALAAHGPGRFSVDHWIAALRAREAKRVKVSLSRGKKGVAPARPVQEWVSGSWDVPPAAEPNRETSPSGQWRAVVASGTGPVPAGSRVPGTEPSGARADRTGTGPVPAVSDTPSVARHRADADLQRFGTGAGSVSAVQGRTGWQPPLENAAGRADHAVAGPPRDRAVQSPRQGGFAGEGAPAGPVRVGQAPLPPAAGVGQVRRDPSRGVSPQHVGLMRDMAARGARGVLVPPPVPGPAAAGPRHAEPVAGGPERPPVMTPLPTLSAIPGLPVGRPSAGAPGTPAGPPVPARPRVAATPVTPAVPATPAEAQTAAVPVTPAVPAGRPAETTSPALPAWTPSARDDDVDAPPRASAVRAYVGMPAASDQATSTAETAAAAASLVGPAETTGSFTPPGGSGLSAAVRRTLARRGAGGPAPEPTPFGVATQAPLDFTPTSAIPVTRPPIGSADSAEYRPTDTEALPVAPPSDTRRSA